MELFKFYDSIFFYCMYKIKEFYISKITGKKYQKQTVATTMAKLISPQTYN